MNARTGTAVEAWLRASPSSGPLAQLFALATMAKHASYPAGYVAADTWRGIVVPTSAGRLLLDRVASHHVPESDLLLALLGLFWFRDPLVDAERTDALAVRQTVETEVLEKRMFLPPLQGRALYDRYNGVYEAEHDALNASQFVC